MYEITSWEDLRRIAPAGAVYFRYRRPTGERRKWFEGGHAFPLSPEGLSDRKPLHTEGTFAICFYTEAEAMKEPAKGCPLIIQLPDCDEVFVEFPKGYKPGDSSEALIIRELLNSNKDMARTASGAADSMLKLLEKSTHERDLMAAEADKNRIGPMWTLILQHSAELKHLLIELAPAVGAFASMVTERVSGQASATQLLQELRKENQQAVAGLRKESQNREQQLAKSVRALAMVMKEMRGDQKKLNRTLSPKSATSRRKKKTA